MFGALLAGDRLDADELTDDWLPGAALVLNWLDGAVLVFLLVED